MHWHESLDLSNLANWTNLGTEGWIEEKLNCFSCYRTPGVCSFWRFVYKFLCVLIAFLILLYGSVKTCSVKKQPKFTETSTPPAHLSTPPPGISSNTYPWWQAPNLQREAMQQLEGHSPSSSSASSASVHGASAQGDPDTWNKEEQNLNTQPGANYSVEDPELG